MFTGHITTKWGEAYKAFLPRPAKPKLSEDQWATKVILAFWKYSKAIWNHRNRVLHEHTTKHESASKIRRFWKRAKQHYQSFEIDRYIGSSTIKGRQTGAIQQYCSLAVDKCGRNCQQWKQSVDNRSTRSQRKQIIVEV
jgi:hypothetical protein